jgi:hypothetical protein
LNIQQNQQQQEKCRKIDQWWADLLRRPTKRPRRITLPVKKSWRRKRRRLLNNKQQRQRVVQAESQRPSRRLPNNNALANRQMLQDYNTTMSPMLNRKNGRLQSSSSLPADAVIQEVQSYNQQGKKHQKKNAS